jgi:hypothetical protein
MWGWRPPVLCRVRADRQGFILGKGLYDHWVIPFTPPSLRPTRCPTFNRRLARGCRSVVSGSSRF